MERQVRLKTVVGELCGLLEEKSGRETKTTIFFVCVYSEADVKLHNVFFFFRWPSFVAESHSQTLVTL